MNAMNEPYIFTKRAPCLPQKSTVSLQNRESPIAKQISEKALYPSPKSHLKEPCITLKRALYILKKRPMKEPYIFRKREIYMPQKRYIKETYISHKRALFLLTHLHVRHTLTD